MNYAPYGESGFLSDQQIKEDEPMKIYHFDLDMAEVVDEIENIILEHDIEIIMKKLSELDNVLSSRNQFIREHK
jgi:predicted transcriptional regulator